MVVPPAETALEVGGGGAVGVDDALYRLLVVVGFRRGLDQFASGRRAVRPFAVFFVAFGEGIEFGFLDGTCALCAAAPER